MPRFGFLTPTDDDWRPMFEFNLFSVVRAIRAAIPALRERGGGSIVNVSTAVAHQPSAMNVDYGIDADAPGCAVLQGAVHAAHATANH